MIRFEILTPLGFTVRTSNNYWQRLIKKHPDIEELETLIIQTLQNPDEVRCSKSDIEVVLFYQFCKQKR